MNAAESQYQKDVDEALNRAYKDAADRRRKLQLDRDSWIIFSDQHKGARDGADDFQDCEKAYHAALAYYLEKDFTLAVLGDVEELWENRPRPVLKRYRLTLELENEFHRQDRYLRFWGNHDDDWESARRVESHLGEHFENLSVQESLRVAVVDDDRDDYGEFFLIHGHQGTLFSDRLRHFSWIPVRYLWRPFQRITKIKSTTPAKDWRLRQKHNIAMYNWAASSEGIVLIAGHTHRPIFRSRDHVAVLVEELERLRSNGAKKDRIAEKSAELAYVRAQEGRLTSEDREREMEKPCYFNTGCCSYADGDVTGIEIDSGLIRLVRWPDDNGDPKPQVLVEAKLKDVFSEVANPAPRVGLP